MASRWDAQAGRRAFRLAVTRVIGNRADAMVDRALLALLARLAGPSGSSGGGACSATIARVVNGMCSGNGRNR